MAQSLLTRYRGQFDAIHAPNESTTSGLLRALREAGLLKFTNPQSPVQMTVKPATRISDSYLQVRPGGDIAAILGIIKRVFEIEDEQGGILDHAFIAGHTTGIEALPTGGIESVI